MTPHGPPFTASSDGRASVEFRSHAVSRVTTVSVPLLAMALTSLRHDQGMSGWPAGVRGIFGAWHRSYPGPHETGTLVLHRFDDGHVEIVHADPVIHISGVLLKFARLGWAEYPWGEGCSITLTVPRNHQPCEASSLHFAGGILLGSVVRIEAGGRTVIYVITEWDRETDAYLAKWPD